MTTPITIRLEDNKHQRLKVLAKQKGISINRLIDEMTTVILTELDLENRYKASVLRGTGKAERGIELLAKAAGENH
ncbi:MAG: toxin-antitoxin system HicB family antitoxin [Thiolinea sp.]